MLEMDQMDQMDQRKPNLSQPGLATLLRENNPTFLFQAAVIPNYTALEWEGANVIPSGISSILNCMNMGAGDGC